jgi:hypothetical protein
VRKAFVVTELKSLDVGLIYQTRHKSPCNSLYSQAFADHRGLLVPIHSFTMKTASYMIYSTQ